MVCLSCLRLALPALIAALQAGATVNPFSGQKYYVSPTNYKQYDSAIVTVSGTTKKNLEVMQKVPSAYWIDVREKIKGSSSRHLEGILKDAASKPTPELVVLIWYDLPNRDCDAKASRGEICCAYTASGLCDYEAETDCSAGIGEYKTTYVNPFIEVLQAYQDRVPVAIVMEPDSIANLATNSANPHCGNPATKRAYTEGMKYAIDELTSKTPKVTVYLDAAHGGWLGWQDNLLAYIGVLKGMHLSLSGVRGFATNVANYQTLGSLCPYQPENGYRNGFCLAGKHQDHPCCDDPCGLSKQYSFGNNELNYARGLVAAAHGELGMTAHVIIDTGRNGAQDQRQNCANWCNIRGAGAGIPSTAKTADPSFLDAYYWLKTPGESDGCTGTLPNGKACPRFDWMCGSPDSLGSSPQESLAPEAGHWYDFQVKQLAANANFNGTAPPRPPRPQRHQHDSPPPPQHRNPQAQGQCGKAFSQCGGLTFSGTSCCEEGCECKGKSEYYSQCMPRDPRRNTCTAPVLQEMSAGFLSRGRRGRQVS